MASFDIVGYLKENKALVDESLRKHLDNQNSLFDMMHYSTEGGKRIRPILAITSFQANGGSDLEIIMPIACGLELIHTYSLIHDDLPSMDNDDLRRGKPSAHRKYGEAQAILSGDGLFAYAFELLSFGNGMVREKQEVIKAVSKAVGPKGVVYGQMLDIKEDNEINPKILRLIHFNKTAKLIATSIECGAIMACADNKIIEKLVNAGTYMGMLFQYTDDILDVVGQSDTLGKTPGKDSATGKLTAPMLYGLDGARFRARRYSDMANNIFESLGGSFRIFKQITTFILNRSF